MEGAYCVATGRNPKLTVKVWDVAGGRKLDHAAPAHDRLEAAEHAT